MKIDRKAMLSWTAVILWMLLIFAFSAQQAAQSEKVSHGLASVILMFIGSLLNSAGIDVNWMNGIVRKSAHAFLFFVLAALVFNAFLKTGVKGIRAFIFALAVTFLYACSDELHQLFVPGRACMLSDVGIDSLGAICGLCLSGAVYWLSIHGKINFNDRINAVIYKFNVFKSQRSSS